jgi:hypothetical protein
MHRLRSIAYIIEILANSARIILRKETLQCSIFVVIGSLKSRRCITHNVGPEENKEADDGGEGHARECKISEQSR